MTRYSVILRSDEASTPREFEHELDGDVSVDDIIEIEGLCVLVDELTQDVDGRRVIECRRLWKLAIRDPEGNTLEPGFIVNEQRHFGQVETLILEPKQRFRLLSVEQSWPEGFDGALTVEVLKS